MRMQKAMTHKILHHMHDAYADQPFVVGILFLLPPTLTRIFNRVITGFLNQNLTLFDFLTSPNVLYKKKCFIYQIQSY